MSLLLALVGDVVVGRRFKRYAKGYVRKGHKVLVFDSEELAQEYIAAEEAQKAIKNAGAARVAKPKPVETVSIPKVEAQAKDFNIDFAPIQDRQVDYDRLIATYKLLMELQDEEDILLLI